MLEARERIGWRLRTVDLMLDGEWKDEPETSSDLYKVRSWSPVDVGGFFIHGSGYVATPENNVPSTGGDAKQLQNQPPRTSKRLHTPDKKQPCKHTNEKIENGTNDNHMRRSDGGIGLNPVYVLARQRMRLPIYEASDQTVLVDNDGNLISGEVDRQVEKVRRIC